MPNQHRMHPYCHQKALTIDNTMRPNATRSYFKSTELAAIYNFPSPNPTDNLVVGVISFGDGLVGPMSPSGILTNGDCQTHWAYLGIPSVNFPQVIIVPISGATNRPNPSDSATIENTIDVQTIGAMCPSAKLTILLYLAPNSFAEFANVITKASNASIINGIRYTPSVISCSWGATETLYPPSLLTSLNAQLASLSAKGIVFTAATGDYGSSNGLEGTNCDFPSSSPYVVACGGTTLICPNYTYDDATMEIGWTDGGGGISKVFSKPEYQSALPGNGRNTPDIALVADPDTGVVYTIGSKLQVIGGTSIVAPAIAAYMAILNLNKALTPLLYTVPSSNFRDILMGSNGAYSAKTGYDNCTGLGAIHGTQLANSLTGNTPEIPITGLTLNQATLSLVINATATLIATVVPANATHQTVSWSSSNPFIATVSSTGLVTGIAEGTTTITAGVTATCVVTVSIPVIHVTSVTIMPTATKLSLKQTATLTAVVTPLNATNKTIIWSSSNPNSLTMAASMEIRSSAATIVAIGSGQTTITAACDSVQTTLSITVVPSIASIALVPASLVIAVGTTNQTVVVFTPSESAVPITLWISSNPTIATVDANGLVQALKVGTATITAGVDGKIATQAVTVR